MNKKIHIALPSETVFHSIESAIKDYRKFAQKNLTEEIPGITIDQGLILMFLDTHPEMTQNEIAELVFKDAASLTRIINTMVQKDYLTRSVHPEDRRRFRLAISDRGKEILRKLPSVVKQNREVALHGISPSELHQLKSTLNKIKANCETPVAV